jgi:hypothetical protein
MLQKIAQFLLQKRSHAAAIAFLCGVLPFVFAGLGMIIMAFVTLRKGAREGLFVLFWAALPLVASAYVAGEYLSLALSLIGFFLVWGMAVGLACLSSWSFLIQVSALAGVAVVALVHLSGIDVVSWWMAHLENYWQMIGPEDGAVSEEVKVKLRFLASLATGFEVFVLLSMALLKLVFARWLQAITVNPGGLKKELHQIYLGRGCLIVLSVLGLAALLSQSWSMLDTLLPLAGMYMIAGLSVLHYWLAPYRYAVPAILGFYVIIVIVPYAMLAPLLIGVLDSGLNLRKKMSS